MEGYLSFYEDVIIRSTTHSKDASKPEQTVPRKMSAFKWVAECMFFSCVTEKFSGRDKTAFSALSWQHT